MWCCRRQPQPNPCRGASPGLRGSATQTARYILHAACAAPAPRVQVQVAGRDRPGINERAALRCFRRSCACRSRERARAPRLTARLPAHQHRVLPMLPITCGYLDSLVPAGPHLSGPSESSSNSSSCPSSSGSSPAARPLELPHLIAAVAGELASEPVDTDCLSAAESMVCAELRV
jgi:hypothetical protein